MSKLVKGGVGHSVELWERHNCVVANLEFEKLAYQLCCLIQIHCFFQVKRMMKKT